MTVDERFDQMEARFDRMDARFEAMQRSISDLTRSLLDFRQETNTRFQTMERYILDFRQEVVIRFDSLESRFEILATAVSSLDARMPSMAKGLMNFGMEHKDLFIEQSRFKEINSNLAARVEKLEEIVSRLVKPAA
jgi:hypothetical protein